MLFRKECVIRFLCWFPEETFTTTQWEFIDPLVKIYFCSTFCKLPGGYYFNYSNNEFNLYPFQTFFEIFTISATIFEGA